MIPTYVWVTVSVLGGLILFYFICLKLSANDWIGVIPPGPAHWPVIGCFLHLFRISNLNAELERLFLVFGNVIKYCIFQKTVVLTRDFKCIEDLLNKDLLLEKTHLFVIDAIRSLGIPICKSKESLEKYFEIGRSIYNFKITIKDFRLLMEESENYKSVLHMKKIENLVFTVTSQTITFDNSDKKDLEECSKEVEVFKSSIETTPQMYLPGSKFWPHFLLRRKGVYKSVLRAQQKLRELIDKKLENPISEDVFNLVFTLYVFMSLSKTSPRRQKSTKKDAVNLDVFPDCILSMKEDHYELSFDVCGIRFFKALDYIKIMKYDIPQQALVILYSNE